jgi:hypothetical protein
MSETTFGCGEFLPGRGPFNFPDFIEGGTINNPGPDPGFDPTDPNTTTPPEFRECECRPNIGTLATFPLYVVNGWRYFNAYVQKECVEIVNGFPADNTIEVIQQVTASITAIPQVQLISTDPGSEDCIDPEPDPGEPPPNEQDCETKNCDPIIITYRIPVGTLDPSGDPSGTPYGFPGLAGPVYGIKDCKCTIVDLTPQIDSVYEAGGITFTATWQRQCADRNAGGQNSSDFVGDWIQQNLPPEARVLTSPPQPDEDCAEVNGDCDPDPNFCDPFVLQWFIRLSVNIEDQTPSEPEPFDPNPPGVLDPSAPPPPPDDPGGGVTSVDVIGEGGGVVLGGDPPGPETGPIAIPLPPGGPGDTGITNVGEQPNAPPPVNPGAGEGEGPNPISPVAIPDPPTSPEPIDSTIPTGEFLTSRRTKKETETDLLSRALTANSIDLSNQKLVEAILEKRPAGVEDEEVFFDTLSKPRKIVKNTSKATNIFKDFIDESLLKLLQSNLDYGDWDSSLAGDITVDVIYNNLNKEAIEELNKINNFDGSPLSKDQIFSIVGSRVLDGTIRNVTISYLARMANASSPDERFTVKRSSNNIVNETVALALIEKNYYPLDYQASLGRGFEVLKNKKTLSSDIDKYIEVTIAGETKRYYVNDDDTFIDRSTLTLEDGDYFDLTLGGEVTRLYAQSEKDHAYFVPEKTKQIALDLLGGDTSKTLSVSGDPRGIELDYSLSAPRQNIYFLSCVLDSLDTVPDAANPKFLKRSRARYENVPLTNIDQINEYVKYKDNHQTFVIDDEDLLLDYVERDGRVFLEQTDIILDSPKENKTLPLLTRQLPWYILLYPTNKPENNPFNSKSQIINYTTSSSDQPETMTRQLRTSTTIIPDLRNKYNQFISVELVGKNARDIFDNPDSQARINKLNLNNPLLSSGYRDFDNNLVSAQSYSPNRQKTGFRLISEIITNLDQNYLLGLNGIGKSLTEFDVLCRLNLRQFNKLFRMENFKEIKRTLFNGTVSDVKVVPATKNSDSKISLNKTQLVRRKSTAPATDAFPEVKSTNFGRSLVPPTVEDPPTFGSFTPAPPPTALP